MPRFLVTITERSSYEFEMDAESEDDAYENAADAFLDGRHDVTEVVSTLEVEDLYAV